MKIKYLILASFAGAIITADQATKMWIHTHLLEGEILPVIANLFNITHVHNMGAAFGFLSESHPDFRKIFFLAMPPIALLIILAILRGIKESDKWVIAALSSVFGGAIGNYIDRLHYGYVIDFLDFTVVYSPTSNPPGRFVYPSFNVADIAIVCGVAVLLFLEFTRGNRNLGNYPERTPRDTAN
jgi:signal peptidase II